MSNDTNEPTVSEPTIESLTLELETAKQTITNLRYEVGMKEQYSNTATRLREQIKKAENYISEAISNGDVEHDDAIVSELATIFNWDLTTEVEITLTATIRGTLTVPLGKDASDIDGSQFSVDASLDWDLSYQDWEFTQNEQEIELEVD